MLPLLVAVLGLIFGAAIGYLIAGRRHGAAAEASAKEAEHLLAAAKRDADGIRREAELETRSRMLEMRQEAESALDERRLELSRLEERIDQRERAITGREEGLGRKEEEFSQRDEGIGKREAELTGMLEERREELERLSGMTGAEARETLLQDVEKSSRHEAARLVRRVEEEAKSESERRVRTIMSTVLQRLAASHTSTTTVSSVALPSDDLKGRIIGREGRNIRALETLTGVDVIIDDTPGAVMLSAFDGVRREIARVTLEKLLEDGRIHPARIEEMYYQAKAETEDRIVQAGEQATFEANVPGLHPELIKVLGRLNYRTSYGQNVLKHSLECAHLGAMMAAELGANEKTARRACLLHDIGKAVTHEVEGSHAVISAQLCRKYGESPAVCHAIEAHHFDVEPSTVEAVLVQAADAMSAARPGARGESLENYVKRLEALETIAMSKPGVERCYAMQAGRDVRVMVKPSLVDDDSATLLAQQIAREIEQSLEYPGQIKVTVIRESRASEFAK